MIIFKDNSFFKYIIIAPYAFLVYGCGSTEQSEIRYSSSEVGKGSSVERCRVLEARQVVIREDGNNTIGSVAGGVVGGLLGGIGGSAVGQGKLNDATTVAGAGAGAVAGSMAGKSLAGFLGEKKGVEYSVVLSDGSEKVFTQGFTTEDRLIQPGETCRISLSSDGISRVLPAENLPGQVSAPKKTFVVR